MGSFIEVTKRGRIAVLRLDHPDSLNAMGTIEDCEDLVDALADIEIDRDISVGILTGNGRAFSAGGNLKSMRDRNGLSALEQPDSTRTNYRRGVQRVTRAFLDLEVPMIAAINGHAVGLGCDLACLCDVRIAAASARFAASFIKVGIVPGDGGAWLLQRVVGYSKAAELFLTGDAFDAHTALEIGLVTRVVQDAALQDEALALAERIAVNPPRAVRMTKRLLREAQHLRMSDVLELSAAYQAIIHETADHHEALSAMIERRAAVFTGD